jgi:hypothetical protein
MSRRSGIDYAGAAGRTELGEVAGLGRRFVVQKKVDGIYARVHLDGRGRVVSAFTRKGVPLRADWWADLKGCLVGAPHAELCGELEAMTEAGERAAAARGYRVFHAYDLIHDGRRRLAGAPYRARLRELAWSAAWAAQAAETGRWQGEDQGVRDRLTGRWSRELLGPAGLERVRLVDQLPVRHADRAWAEWVANGGGEGLVVVDLDAPMGARRAKRKVKAVDHLDARVVAIDLAAAIVEVGPLRFAVSARGIGDRDIKPGDVVELAHNGWERSLPRHPRILRSRPDLGGMIGG